MSDKRKPHTYETDIVEALLEGKDASSAQCLSTAQAHIVEQWEKVISVAQSDVHETDQAIIDSVMSRIEAGLEQETTSSKGFHTSFGRVAALAAMILLVAGVFVSTQVNLATEETPYSVAQKEIEMGAEKISSSASVTHTSFPLTSISSKGSVLLSNHESSGSVIMASALRLEAVNGNLRIDSL